MSKRRLPLRAEKTGSAGGPNGGKRARRAGNKVDTAVDSGSDSSESDGEILLADARVEHDDMEVTFEFNDMKAAYAEGVTTLLRWFLPSHEAYELAAVICNQGDPVTVYLHIITNICIGSRGGNHYQLRWGRRRLRICDFASH